MCVCVCVCVCACVHVCVCVCACVCVQIYMYINLHVFYRELFGSTNTGINFEKYDDIPVEATGEGCPKHVTAFEECNFSEIIQNNIKVSYPNELHLSVY